MVLSPYIRESEGRTWSRKQGKSRPSSQNTGNKEEGKRDYRMRERRPVRFPCLNISRKGKSYRIHTVQIRRKLQPNGQGGRAGGRTGTERRLTSDTLQWHGNKENNIENNKKETDVRARTCEGTGSEGLQVLFQKELTRLVYIWQQTSRTEDSTCSELSSWVKEKCIFTCGSSISARLFESLVTSPRGTLDYDVIGCRNNWFSEHKGHYEETRRTSASWLH